MASKKKLIKWNESVGGVYYPEELEAIYNSQSKIFKEKESAEGYLSIRKIPVDNPSGAALLDLGSGDKVKKNLIVDGGRAAIATMMRDTAIGGGNSPLYSLGYLAVGYGGAGMSPAHGTVALWDESTSPTGPPVNRILRPIMSVSTPAPAPFMTNIWTAQIASDELNVAPYDVINNAGMYCLDNATLFCIRTFLSFTKTIDFIYQFIWLTAF
jgi:hypothetical protein